MRWGETLMLRFGVVAAAAVSICGCWPVDVDVPPQVAYAMVAGTKGSDPVPSGVKNLQADGAIWMDMHFCCRFTAPESVIKLIVDSGYKQMTWDAIAPKMRPEHYTERFSPKWNPAAITQKECFFKTIERGDDSVDIVYLVVDRSGGVVYAVGEGPRTPPQERDE